MTDILIAGAGPTGLTLAIDLLRRGVSVRIIDRATRPDRGVRGKGLQPRTLEVFDDLGVLPRLLEAGSPYPAIHVHAGGIVVQQTRIDEVHQPSPDIPYPNLWMVPQYRTEEVLRDRLAALGGAVEWGVELTAFESGPDAVTAILDGTEQLTVAYLVGADGGRSTVRKALAIPFAGETHEQERLLLADVTAGGIDRDVWHVWATGPDDMVGLCPMPHSDAFQLVAAADGEPTSENLQRILDERKTGVWIQEVLWSSTYRPNIRMVDRFRVGRVFLAGDAAHVHSPAGGQGLNTGVQDAYNLGWKLGAVLRGAPDELLDSYEAERLPVAAWVLGLTSRYHRSAELKTRGTEARQLQLSYREGPLAGTGGVGRLQPGDRAPDAPCATRDGTTTTLFDLFRGPQFTVLALGEDAVPASHSVRVLRLGADLLDPDGHVRATYGEGTVLIRPDGYVATFDDVAGYLERVS
jgi:2-polyprenyl-6-methoxyphenol hydroxylase-like FAD-dependent oxidoreductase